MSSSTSTQPAPLQSRHFASPENLTSLENLTIHDREAHLRDFLKLQKFSKSKAKRQRTLENKFKKIVGLKGGMRIWTLAVVQYFANKGSLEAQEMFDKHRHLENVHQKIMAKEDYNSVISELAEFFRKSEYDLVNFDAINPYQVLFEVKMRELPTSEKSELDKEIRICFTAYDVHKKIPFLEQCIKKYPEEVTFRIFLCHAHSLFNSEELIEVADAAIKMFPKNYILLKMKAIFCHSINKYQEAVDTCLKLLEVAPGDYEYLPYAYYLTADGLHGLNAPMSQVEKYFKWGLEAEEKRLPFLSPVDCPLKKPLEDLIQSLKPGVALLKAQGEVERNGAKGMCELLGIYRVVLILRYREEKMKVNEKGFKMRSRVEPKIRKRKFSVEKIEFITLTEILKKKGATYKFGMKCFVIEDAVVIRSLVRLLVEDAAGQCVEVYVKNGSKEFAEKFVFAMKISLLNPYVWRDEDDEGKIEIWIGGQDCIIFEEEQDLNRCRFCWRKEALKNSTMEALKKCANCKKCFYCSNECQDMDWMILKHEYICEK